MLAISNTKISSIHKGKVFVACSFNICINFKGLIGTIPQQAVQLNILQLESIHLLIIKCNLNNKYEEKSESGFNYRELDEENKITKLEFLGILKKFPQRSFLAFLIAMFPE